MLWTLHSYLMIPMMFITLLKVHLLFFTTTAVVLVTKDQTIIYNIVYIIIYCFTYNKVVRTANKCGPGSDMMA